MSFIIRGLQKLSLLDYPEKMCCTVFTGGCNFRCPFCHNSELVLTPDDNGEIDTEHFFEFLGSRHGRLDGVTITGGEPLLYDGTADFMRRIREMGFAVKLDTNGSFPDRLEEIIRSGLADYIAMDIKNSLAKYPQTIGIPDYDTTKVEKSADMLMSSGTPFEFRTTCVSELHDVSSFEDIGRRFAGNEKYYLQQFVDSGSLIAPGLHACTKPEMTAFLTAVKAYIPNTEFRGF